MKNREKAPTSGPGRPQKYSERLVRKEVLLLESQVAAIDKFARETRERDVKPYSFTEALRDVVGLWMQKEGR